MTDDIPDNRVERVARAIADTECSFLRSAGINAELKHWKLYERQARAAITATRSAEAEEIRRLRAKAWQLSRPANGNSACQHICWQAANRLASLSAAKVEAEKEVERLSDQLRQAADSLEDLGHPEQAAHYRTALKGRAAQGE